MSHPSRWDHDSTVCQQAREDAAMALLTRRRPDPDVVAHLEACPPCGDEFAELLALTPLLDATRELVDVPPPTPDPALLERLLTAVARHRRRRRLVGGVLAVAAAAAVAVAVVAPIHLLSGSGRPVAAGSPTTSGTEGPGANTGGGDEPLPTGPLLAQGMAADPATGALAHVSVRRQSQGVAVRVEVEGVAEGTPCHLVLHRASGSVTEVGHWTAGPGENTYAESVSTPAADIREVELLDGTGRRIVTVPLRTV